MQGQLSTCCCRPQEAVAAAVAQLCRALPLAVEGACQCLAERYAALALEAALGRMAPRLLCRLLLSCGPNGDGTATAGGAPPVGTDGRTGRGGGTAARGDMGTAGGEGGQRDTAGTQRDSGDPKGGSAPKGHSGDSKGQWGP